MSKPYKDRRKRIEYTKSVNVPYFPYVQIISRSLAAKKLEFQDSFDILLEMRLGDVAEQGYIKLYGKSQIYLKRGYKL